MANEQGPKKPKKESHLMGRLFADIAPRIGARVEIEPEWGIAGRIIFKNGTISYFRYNTVDLNPVGAADIAKDKDYASYFMRISGYPTIEGKTFFRKDWHTAIGAQNRTLRDAYEYAQSLGFPVVLKPNSGSQGKGVAVVYGKKDFYEAARVVFEQDKILLVQRYHQGRDYRLVVLDGSLISAYERTPLTVIGDGASTIRTLIKEMQNRFYAKGRSTHIDESDPRILRKLRRAGMSLNSIPKCGTPVRLLDNANLSTGGEAVDVSKTLNPAYVALAARLAKDMGLRLAGVDLLVRDSIDTPLHEDSYTVIEINAAPGLDHYAAVGDAQQAVVEDLYLQVLRAIESGNVAK